MPEKVIEPLHQVMLGSGDRTLMLLHGLSQSHETFVDIAGLMTSTLRLQMVDLPGHGRSCRLDQYDVADMVERVAALLQGGAAPVSLYGHSLGALVAMGVAARHPEQVGRLVLSDPPLIFWDSLRWEESVISSYFGWVRKTMRSLISEAELICSLQAAFPHRAEEALQRQARGLRQLDVRIIDMLFDTGLADHEQVFSWLADIRCPVLLLQADPRILAAANDADVTHLLDLVADCRHVKFDNADHDLHLWKPHRVAAVVNDFLG